MAGLSYSAHLSQKNSAINSKAKLSGVAKHNLRKYRSLEYDKENIVILWGTDKLVQDVKKVYKEQFDEAVRELPPRACVGLPHHNVSLHLPQQDLVLPSVTY